MFSIVFICLGRTDFSVLAGKQQTNKFSMDGLTLSNNVKSNHHGNATIVETNTDCNKQVYIYIHVLCTKSVYKIIMLKITGSNEPLSHTW